MASIKKRPNGTYQATIYVGRDSNGKQLFEYVTRDKLSECKAAVREIEQELEEGKFTKIKNMRVIALINKHIQVIRYSPNTRAKYKRYIKDYYEPFFKDRKVKDINEYIAEEFKTIITGKCPGSARNIFAFLKQVFYKALKYKSPFEEVKLPEEKKVDYNIPETEDFEKIHEFFFGKPIEPIFLLAGWAGLRRGEIFALKPDDLDYNKNTVRVDEDYIINEEGKYEFGPPKSKNGYRTVVIPLYLMELLRPIAEERQKELMSIDQTKLSKTEIEEMKRLFQGRPDNFSSQFAKLIRRNKLPKIRFHDLRHYQATWLQDNGFPEDYAAKRMGQSKDVLRKIYQHLRPKKEEDLDAKIIELHKEPRRIKYKKLIRTI